MNRRPALAAFLFSLSVHAVTLSLWYATRPHDSGVASYVPWLAAVCAGATLAVLVPHRIERSAMLAVCISLVSVIINWVSGRLGQPVEFGTVGVSLQYLLLSLPIHVIMTLVGSALGVLIRRIYKCMAGSADMSEE